ncbi:hypothetical protein OIU84_011600 [Salix udensis]|uniref:Uncharacterized protein n=1 Tax=Salix udensis TaxID=889485 RepID=A0AAD6JNH9_9ROSI|nr:hypothetical protein OIU84_011600 [Salix udensis]
MGTRKYFHEQPTKGSTMEAPQLSKLWREPKLLQTAKLDCFANQLQKLENLQKPPDTWSLGTNLYPTATTITSHNLTVLLKEYRFLPIHYFTNPPPQCGGDRSVREGKRGGKEKRRGTTWKSLVATLSVREGLQAGMDSWGGDVTPKGKTDRQLTVVGVIKD